MKLYLSICILLCFTQNVFVSSEDDFENLDLDDDDIPVIEGDGGTITTAVEEDVLILTRENFDIQIASKDIILVEFYAPWCGHCKSLAPEYAKAAKILKNEDPPISLGKVDATIETDLAARYDVTGYPTLYIFKKGQRIAYEGPRTAMGIVEYMKERSDPNWKPPPEAVLTLTSENFTETVEKAEIILVEFYAPWCGHCKQLAPEYERAARVLRDFPDPIPLAKVDGTAEKDLADQYEARGWPTLMIFRKGRKFAYEGPRDEPGIISYMKEQAKPPSQLKKSLKEIESALGKIDSTVLGFFNSEEDPFYMNFQEAANTLRGKFNFLHSFNKKLMSQYKVQKPSVLLIQPELYVTPYEPSKFVFDNAEASASDIVGFVRQNFLPLVGERSTRSMWKYENKYPLVVVYYDVDFSFDHRVQTQLIRGEVAKVAKEYRGRLTFCISKEEDFEEELATLGLSDSGEDVNVGMFESDAIRYRMEPTEDFSAEELQAFVEDVLAGEIPRHIRSQPAPRDNAGPVVTVVGSTFDALVTRSPRDVFLEFYAPWCGHCRSLEPVYKKLAKALDGKPLMVAKMDATANDYPDTFRVAGFPTLYYVPHNDKQRPVPYEGDRTLDSLMQFVEKQLSTAKDEL